MIFRPRAALALLTVLFALVFPAAASAAFVVNSTADEPDLVPGGECLTVAGKCTLRAAIEVTNLAGSADNILFDATVFEGQLADTIALGSPLPAIKAPVAVNAGTCLTAAGVNGPCAGVSGPTGNFGISVEADGVSISDLAVTGALTGINVINESTDFTARGNWVGVKLDGTAGANNTGIFIDPGSDGATIGGTEVVQRNVIAGNNLEGLDVEGASGAVVQGNYFGVAPNGTTAMSNAKDVEITDSTAGSGFEAVDNEVGATIGEAARATPTCDGGCNVIGGATSTGLDLDGGSGGNEAPASGPTFVRGNFVGLGADGSTVVQNGIFGILAGAADSVTVGGTEEGQTNTVVGGAYGIYGENGDDLEVLSNVIGVDKSGAPATPPSTVGIFSYSLNISGPEAGARIGLNSVQMNGGTGIEQRFTGGEIFFNSIFDAGTGILTTGGSIGEGNLIEGNRAIRAGGNGILIENDSNVVIRNEVEEAGEAGILVKYAGVLPLASESSGNVIGGDEEFEENELRFNGGPAIEIKDFEKTNNEVARNNGEGNGGQFIDLVKAELTEPNGPNEGIQPPTITAARQSSIEGTAEPGATVRVFRKASSEPGELASFLAMVVADPSGSWKATYPSIPTGTIVAATQTSIAGGTSELATDAAAADPSEGGGGSGGGGGGNGGGASGGGGNNNGGGKGPNKDTTPPETKIVKGPPKKTHKTTAKFKFTATESGSKLQCKLDRKPFKACRSPKTYKKLKPGKHVFKVRAIDRAGNVDPTPAKRKFTVLG